MTGPTSVVVDDHDIASIGKAWVSDALTPRDSATWDLLVIGGGTAGIVAAETAASFGASVLLVERDRPGGECLWTGCVPSKALLAAAHAAAAARAAARFGVHAGGVRVDFGDVMRHVVATIGRVEPDDSPAALRAAGVRVVHGRAEFTGRDRAAVSAADAGADPGGAGSVLDTPAEVRFRHAVIATGSHPLIPAVPGLGDAEPLTSDTIWVLTELPSRLLVLGGGSIGCELGQAFARLGSTVTLVEAGPDLLSGEDPGAAGLLGAALVEDGIRLVTGARLVSVEPTADGFLGHVSDGSTVPFDRLLLAVGRAPRVAGLGLTVAGVDTDDRGQVCVTPQLRTTNARIYAAGDVTGQPRFTHVAGVHGSVAATNAVLGLRRRADTAAVPRVTYTQPEVASVGVCPDHAARREYTVQSVPHDELDRARAEDDERGVTRLVLDHHGHLVGATIVGPRAGESLAELVLAVQHRLRARDLAGAMHAYPTYGDGPWKAALADVQQRLARRPTRDLIRLLAWRQRRVSSP